MNRKWWTLYNLVKTAEAKYYFVTRKEELGYFLDTFMGAALYFCSVFDGRENRVLKRFVKIFLCAASFFFFCFIFSWREEWYHMLQEVKLDFVWVFWLLNLPLILLFSILESKYENLHKCNVYKNWLILGGICYSLFIWICTCPTLQKWLKIKMYPIANLAVKSGVWSY